jgi:hypothetical protein
MHHLKFPPLLTSGFHFLFTNGLHSTGGHVSLRNERLKGTTLAALRAKRKRRDVDLRDTNEVLTIATRCGKWWREEHLPKDKRRKAVFERILNGRLRHANSGRR